MKKRILLLIIGFLLFATAMAENSSVMAFGRGWPPGMEKAVLLAGASRPEPVSGYYCIRSGELTCGQAVVRDGNQWMLCAFNYQNNEWKAVVSTQALKQNEAPRLWNEAVAEGWSPETIERFGACDTFDIVYSDIRTSWEFNGSEWLLNRVVLPEAAVAVTERELIWNGETVFNTQSIRLQDWRIEAFPQTLTEAVEMAAGAGFADQQRCVLTCAAGEMVELFSAPSYGVPVLSAYYPGVEANVLDGGNGFVQVEIEGYTGWVEASKALIGLDRAAQPTTWGTPGEVYGWGNIPYQMLYEAAEGGPVVMLQIGYPLRVMGIVNGSEWLHVRLDEGIVGWMTQDTVCHTGNARNVLVQNDLPENRLNLRMGESSRQDTLGKYYSGVYGVRLFTLGDETEYLRVSISGVSGWMKKEFLRRSPQSPGEWLPPTADVNVDRARISAYPAEKADGVALVEQGTKVQVLGLLENWAHVILADGTTGWMTLSVLDGTFTSAVPNAFRLNRTCALNDADGRVLTMLVSDTLVVLDEPRPRVDWQTVNGARVLQLPDMVRVHTADYAWWGLVPADAVETGLQ